MRHTVPMPKLGDTDDGALVLEWLVAVGDAVEEGAPLFTVETSKIETEVTAPVAGTLAEQLVAPDDEVGSGAPVAVIESA